MPGPGRAVRRTASSRRPGPQAGGRLEFWQFERWLVFFGGFGSHQLDQVRR